MKHLKKFNESNGYFTERELIEFGKKVLSEFKGNLEEFESWAMNNLPDDGEEGDGEDFGIESDEDETYETEFDDEDDDQEDDF